MTYPVKQYEMIKTSDLRDFNSQIAELLNKNWQPYGEPMSVQTSAGIVLMQAMVKRFV